MNTLLTVANDPSSAEYLANTDSSGSIFLVVIGIIGVGVVITAAMALFGLATPHKSVKTKPNGQPNTLDKPVMS